MSPCNYLHKEFDPAGLPVSEECIYDRDAQFEYLGPSIRMRILYTEEKFVPFEYGEDKILGETVFREMQFNPRKPSYLGYDLQYEELEDETDLIQFGQTDQISFISAKEFQQIDSFWIDNLIDKPDG